MNAILGGNLRCSFLADDALVVNVDRQRAEVKFAWHSLDCQKLRLGWVLDNFATNNLKIEYRIINFFLENNDFFNRLATEFVFEINTIPRVLVDDSLIVLLHRQRITCTERLHDDSFVANSNIEAL